MSDIQFSAENESEAVNESDEVNSRIVFEERGVVIFEGLDGGEGDVRVRFRTRAIRALEKTRKCSVMGMINQNSLGLDFAYDALLVGSAAQFAAKKGKKALSEERVERWIDNCEENGIPFQDLLEGLVKALIGGMPNGDEYLATMNGEGDTEKK